MKQYVIIITLISTLLGGSSCKEWLKVDSEDRIMEDALFQSESGFFTALNGVYVHLLNTNLYGRTLTAGTFDILAQYYDTTKPLNSHTYRSLANFELQAKKDAVADTWKEAYFLIANINTILEHCENDRSVLSESNYELIKGECLALRAMLHFEMFRIFGPIYSYEPGKVCIPYSDDTEKNVKPLLSAIDVVDKILTDLNQAENLLLNVDPVITKGPQSSAEGNNRLRYRNLRLNYFAVYALTARVYLYAGNTTEAGRYARKVISGASKFFPFATREQVNGQAATGTVNREAEDRIFSSEVLFGAYNTQRSTDIYDKLFSNKLELKNLLTMTENGVKALYDDEGDLRTCHFQALRDIEANDGRFFVKYGFVTDGDLGYASIIPILRISEMYLIVAECEKSLTWVNDLRSARKAAQVSSGGSLDGSIEDEYVREFIGEGQLFWYYKRKGITEIPRLYNRSAGDMKIELSNYQFDLPDKELAERE